MIGKKHSLQNQLKPYNYHMRLPLSTDKINSSSGEDRSFNPKLKVFKMVGNKRVSSRRSFLYLQYVDNNFQDFNSNIKSNKVATFLWPIDRWKSSPGNPNYRMQSENTKRLQRNDSERQERSQIRMTKSAIRVSNFQRSDQRYAKSFWYHIDY